MSMSMQSNFTENVRTALRRSGKTQRKLAEMLDMDEVSISRLLSQKYAPSLNMIERIAEALNIEQPERLLQKNCFGADVALDVA
jgi:transcriptional regulator with XRE-family HTH domain